jgi:hypothetical protein
MADDKRKGGAADRRKVAAGEEHEVAYFARRQAFRKSRRWTDQALWKRPQDAGC